MATVCNGQCLYWEEGMISYCVIRLARLFGGENRHCTRADMKEEDRSLLQRSIGCIAVVGWTLLFIDGGDINHER